MKPDVRTLKSWKWKPSKNAVKASEDDTLRSVFVSELLQSVDTSGFSTLKITNQIPTIIVQFWDEYDIPKDVQGCIDSWRVLEYKGFEHRLFNNSTARQFIKDNLHKENVKAFDRCYHPAMKSDYFRLCFIYCNGGFYVDVDDVYSGSDISGLFFDQRMKLQPLCFDVDANSMISPDKLNISSEFTNNRIFYFNNNPIIAPPRNPIIEYALARSTYLLLERDENIFPEIQSTTGPGNMSASVVAYLADYPNNEREKHLNILTEWEDCAQTIWKLSYRDDDRNWRLSNRKKYTRTKSET
ncbi:Glycosyltransferase sugar-binding region containing DXD motif-containing protein [Marinobacter sp. LV10R510-11A]|uniref:glycosyltransferase family 32 protein n=1 Tax=Marinobacter sp. LV10R510-11A TaxID=1415568 RepID=UPI000BB6B6D9|nr:glycosyltransferase [Marinobacter sp. LV10R510-11A]SOB78084.1 Glycosyltransferase sugar-binding region containing DXD motif-containing protein [Marinobacter sp. LV10R510-11A]